MPVLTALGTAAVLAAGSATAVAGTLPLAGSVRQVSGLAGCYTVDGTAGTTPGTCTNIRGGTGSSSIVLSPDGRFAYLVGYGSNEPGGAPPVLSILSRNAKTGALTQIAGKSGCLSRDGSSEDGPGTCTKARNLDSGDAVDIAISADGRFLYAASQYENASSVRVGGIAIFSRNIKTGTLRQLPGLQGCVSADGSSSAGPHTCVTGREVDSVSQVHITPDQKFLYASTYDQPPHSGIAIFRRNLKTGAITQLAGKEGCITDDGTTNQSGTAVCRAMPNLGSPWDTATPDNRFVYIADSDANLVQAFRRDAKGGLVPLKGIGACVSDGGGSPLGPNTCVDGRGLQDVERVVLSANKQFIYTNSYELPAPIAILNRNLTTGLLSQRSGPAACFSDKGLTGQPSLHCGKARGLDGGYAGVLSPDGSTLYFADYNAAGFVIFRVNKTTGGLRQLTGTAGCVTKDGSSDGTPGLCQKGRAVDGAYQVTLSADGHDLYVASYLDNGAALFHVAP